MDHDADRGAPSTHTDPALHEDDRSDEEGHGKSERGMKHQPTEPMGPPRVLSERPTLAGENHPTPPKLFAQDVARNDIARHLQRLSPDLERPEAKADLVAAALGAGVHETVLGSDDPDAATEELVRLCEAYLGA